MEKEFNSLDAQRESGELFVRSQAGEGCTLVPDCYDDGGFTGGNMERPALRRLMLDIEAGQLIEWYKQAIRNAWNRRDLVVRAAPSVEVSLARRGAARMILGRTAEAERDHRTAFENVSAKAADKNARLAAIWSVRGEAFAYLSRWPEAEGAHREAARLQPGSHVHWSNVAETLLAQNDLDGYRACCRDMLKNTGSTNRASTASGSVATLASIPQTDHEADLLRLGTIAVAAFPGNERA